ncbi:MAG: carboxypeptidase-like regulatory domain-containing protein, partial [Bacteroidales bacterium]
MKKLILFIVLSVTGLFPLLAQTRTITGTVTSSVQNEGVIPGVTVQVKGTTIGTASDVKGKYSITVPKNAVSLIFTYV